MAEKKIKAGDNISMSRPGAATEEARKLELASKVLEFDGDRTMKIAMPMAKLTYIALEPGEIVLMYFFSSGVMFFAEGRVVDRAHEDKMPVATVTLITEPELMQRRQFYRIECIIDAQTHELTEDELKVIEELDSKERESIGHLSKYLDSLVEDVPKWEEGVIVDISGGGIRYHSEEERNKGDRELLAMKLKSEGNIKEYHLLLSIVSSERKTVNRKVFYENRAKFISINDKDREAIVRFVFEEDRKKRSKAAERNLPV